jgi:hypothetical protein
MAYEGYKDTHVHGPWERARVISWHAVAPYMKEQKPVPELFELEIDRIRASRKKVKYARVTLLSDKEKKELDNQLQQLNGRPQ